MVSSIDEKLKIIDTGRMGQFVVPIALPSPLETSENVLALNFRSLVGCERSIYVTGRWLYQCAVAKYALRGYTE